MEIENDLQREQTESSDSFDHVRAKKNVFISLICKVLLLLLSIIVRRFLIKYTGNECNGFNALFTSIIGFLSIAELGIGTAIIYCMYEPIANNNKEKVCQLYCLFKKVYLVIGLIITALGLIILLFLPYLAKDYTDKSLLLISYVLTLISVSITYFYSAKMSLVNAYKNNYISTIITSLGLFVQYALQIIVLIYTKSFIAFCICKIIASSVQYLLFYIYNNKHYKDIVKEKAKIDDETKKEVTKNVKAMFMHKIGDVIFSTVDSLVISAIISVVVLGYYSNYLLILTSMNEVLKLFIVPLTSVLGHMGVKASKEEKLDYFKFFYCINFILGIVFYLGYYSVCTDAVTICFGENLELENNLIILISITYFIQFMRQSASVFKDSFGLFYKDRWVSIIAAVLNAVLSIVLALAFDIYGVLIATIVVDLLIYHIVEPLVLFKYGMNKRPIKYYIINYTFIAFFTIEVLLFSLIELNTTNVWLHLLVSGSISLAINVIPVSLVFIYKPFRKRVKFLFKKTNNNC